LERVIETLCVECKDFGTECYPKEHGFGPEIGKPLTTQHKCTYN